MKRVADNRSSRTAGATARPVSMAFDRLIGFVAIRQTQEGDEVLRQLLMHLAALSNENVASLAAFCDNLDVYFGLQISEGRVQAALDQLLSGGHFRRGTDGSFKLSDEKRRAIRERIKAASDLEARVRAHWIEECVGKLPNLDAKNAWTTLEGYLSRAFRQHGIQTISLIDPSVVIPSEYQDSLRGMLKEALEQNCPGDQREDAIRCIREFLLGAGADNDRSAFMARLADCTVSYYSLTVPPDVAAQLRDKLRPLTLFLDTNVLFGLVGLDDGPVADVSQELVAIVRQHKLPFRLKYHSETRRELIDTFETVSGKIKGTTVVPSNQSRCSKIFQSINHSTTLPRAKRRSTSNRRVFF